MFAADDALDPRNTASRKFLGVGDSCAVQLLWICCTVLRRARVRAQYMHTHHASYLWFSFVACLVLTFYVAGSEDTSLTEGVRIRLNSSVPPVAASPGPARARSPSRSPKRRPKPKTWEFDTHLQHASAATLCHTFQR